MTDDVSRETALTLAGSRGALLEQYAHILATDGVEHGMIGPREVPRLWDRHLLNCLVVAPAIPDGWRVADVGSGAGLPGLVWAVARPDLQITLVEPLLRRTRFLENTIAELGIENVTIRRQRAEDVDETYDLVTARAVAALDKLAHWCWPLVRTGGVMAALKGQSAPAEITAAKPVLGRLGIKHAEVRTYGDAEIPTTVVVLAARAADATQLS